MREYTEAVGIAYGEVNLSSALDGVDVAKRAENLRTILQADRSECVANGAYIAYAEYFDPQWHFAQQQMMQLERQRRSWESDMERERREFDERLEARSRDFLADLDEQRRQWEAQTGKWPNRFVIAAVVLALAEVLGTAMQLPAISRLLHLD